MIRLGKRSLVEALRGACLDSLLVTTFSVDEEELYSLGRHLELDGADVRIRYDPAAFRGFGKRRSVPTSWLAPLRPTSHRSRGRGTPLRPTPPIFHPKLVLAETHGKSARMVVSTGNLASADQRRMSNLLVELDIPAVIAKRVRKWAAAREPRERSLCVVAEGKALRLELGSRPPMELLRERIQAFAPEREEWLLAAPFWSRQVRERIDGIGDPDAPPRQTVRAYFCDLTDVRRYAPALRSKKRRSTASGEVVAFAPTHRASNPGLHHKVVAWRGRRGGKTRVLLYVGSANLTEAGFLGVRHGQRLRAWNWEAGVLIAGDDSIWDEAKRVAEGSITWRKVVIPKKLAPLALCGEGDGNLETLLRVHLRCAIRYTAARVVRRSLPELPFAKLRRVTVTAGERVVAQRLAIGRSASLPAHPCAVTVSGYYAVQQKGAADRVLPVDLELADLAEGPPEDQHASVSLLDQLLERLGEDEASGGSGKPGTSPSPGTGTGRTIDVRFRFGDVLAHTTERPEDAARWLRLVHAQAGRGDVPPFWGKLAEALR